MATTGGFASILFINSSILINEKDIFLFLTGFHLLVPDLNKAVFIFFATVYDFWGLEISRSVVIFFK